MTTSTFDFPSHYRMRMAQIRDEIAAYPVLLGKTVVLLGDSLSEGHPAKTLGDKPVINQGIGGDEMAHENGGLLNRLHLVGEAHPAYVFLLIGVNDLNNSSKTPETLRPQYQELIERLLTDNPLAWIYVQSLLPTRDGYARLNDLINEVNAYLPELCSPTEARFLDLRPVFAAEDGQLKSELTDDGLHLNDAGYLAWTKLQEALLARTSGQTRYA